MALFSNAQGNKIKLDSYDAYFQCYKKLLTIPFTEAGYENATLLPRNTNVVKYPLIIEGADKNKVYLFSDKLAKRYDLENGNTDENETVIYNNLKLIFDDENFYNCVSIGFFADGQFNFGCNDQDSAKLEKWPNELAEIKGHDQKDEETISILRKELLRKANSIEKLSFPRAIKNKQRKIQTMFKNDLASCRDSFKQDQEAYKKFEELATKAAKINIDFGNKNLGNAVD